MPQSPFRLLAQRSSEICKVSRAVLCLVLELRRQAYLADGVFKHG